MRAIEMLGDRVVAATNAAQLQRAWFGLHVGVLERRRGRAREGAVTYSEGGAEGIPVGGAVDLSHRGGERSGEVNDLVATQEHLALQERVLTLEREGAQSWSHTWFEGPPLALPRDMDSDQARPS